MIEKSPVAVYDVLEKKLLFLFDSRTTCSQLLIGKDLDISGLFYMIKNKKRSDNNIFNLLVAYRNPTKEQITLLGNKVWETFNENYTFQISKTRKTI